jgi:mono/diheme cytochrome c family protein
MMHRSLVYGIVMSAVCLCVAAHAQETENSTAELEHGKQVYDKWCTHCHGPGRGLPGFDALPGTQQLSIKYRDTEVPAILDQRTDLVPEYIEVIVRQGVSFMPQFRKTEVSDSDLEALSAYLTRNNPENP